MPYDIETAAKNGLKLNEINNTKAAYKKASISAAKLYFKEDNIEIEKESPKIDINVKLPIEVILKLGGNDSITTDKETSIIITLRNIIPRINLSNETGNASANISTNTTDINDSDNNSNQYNESSDQDENTNSDSADKNLTNEKIPINSFDMILKGMSLSSFDQELEKSFYFDEKDNTTSSMLKWKGELGPGEEIIFQFNIKYDSAGAKEILLKTQYDFLEETITDTLKETLLVDLVQLLPTIDYYDSTASEPEIGENKTWNFKSGNMPNFKFYLENNNSIYFYNLTGYVNIQSGGVSFHQKNFTREDLSPEKRNVAALISKKLPILADDKDYTVIFKGEYFTASGKRFEFNLEQNFTVFKKPDHVQPFRIIHFPLNYSDDKMDVYVGVMDLNQSYDWLEINTYYDATHNSETGRDSYNGFMTTTFGEEELKKKIKSKESLGQSIDYHTISNNNKVDNVSIYTVVRYQKGDDIYYGYLSTTDPLSTYETIVNSMKAMGQPIVKASYKEIENNEEGNGADEDNASKTKDANKNKEKNLLKTFVSYIIFIIVLVLIAVIVLGYTKIRLPKLKIFDVDLKKAKSKAEEKLKRLKRK